MIIGGCNSDAVCLIELEWFLAIDEHTRRRNIPRLSMYFTAKRYYGDGPSDSYSGILPSFNIVSQIRNSCFTYKQLRKDTLSPITELHTLLNFWEYANLLPDLIENYKQNNLGLNMI